MYEHTGLSGNCSRKIDALWGEMYHHCVLFIFNIFFLLLREYIDALVSAPLKHCDVL